MRLLTSKPSELSLATLVLLALLPGIPAQGQKPDWQHHIDWAYQDAGEPNCPMMYNNPVLQSCLAYGVINGLFAQQLGYGNRACASDLAIEAAYRGYDAFALFIEAEVCQCHEGADGARQSLHQVGARAVGDYLRSYPRPPWATAVPF